MITIDQLLESVDLDFEPRWVTKDGDGAIYIWANKPEIEKNIWDAPLEIRGTGFGAIKLTEFHNKPWQECIYEVPRKTTGKIEKIQDELNLQTGEYGKTKFDIIPKETFAMVCRKINELVVAVNELKGAKNE